MRTAKWLDSSKNGGCTKPMPMCDYMYYKYTHTNINIVLYSTYNVHIYELVHIHEIFSNLASHMGKPAQDHQVYHLTSTLITLVLSHFKVESSGFNFKEAIPSYKQCKKGFPKFPTLGLEFHPWCLNGSRLMLFASVAAWPSPLPDWRSCSPRQPDKQRPFAEKLSER